MLSPRESMAPGEILRAKEFSAAASFVRGRAFLRAKRYGSGTRGPTPLESIGWNPNFNAGLSDFSRKSPCSASTKSGSATME